MANLPRREIHMQSVCDVPNRPRRFLIERDQWGNSKGDQWLALPTTMQMLVTMVKSYIYVFSVCYGFGRRGKQSYQGWKHGVIVPRKSCLLDIP